MGELDYDDLCSRFSGSDRVKSRKSHYIQSYIHNEFVLLRANRDCKQAKMTHYAWLDSDNEYSAVFKFINSIKTKLMIDKVFEAIEDKIEKNQLVASTVLKMMKNEHLDEYGLINVNQSKSSGGGGVVNNIQIIVDRGTDNGK